MRSLCIFVEVSSAWVCYSRRQRTRKVRDRQYETRKYRMRLAFLSSLPGPATGCLLHRFFHVVCLPELIFSILLEQSFNWDKRSHQKGIYVCKVL